MRSTCAHRTAARPPCLQRPTVARIHAERTDCCYKRCRRLTAAWSQPGDAAPPNQGPTAQQLSEIDDLINLLFGCRSQEEFQKVVADNILAFDQQFWMRIAARNDAADEEESQRLSSLATTVMRLVEVAVTRTEDQLASSGKIVQEIMKSAANDDGTWSVPLPDDKVETIKQALDDNSDALDEAFLSSCFAYVKKASDDGLVEIVHLLQSILQLYAARHWSQADASGKDDAMLLDILAADEKNWQNMIHDLASAGELSEAAFMATLQTKMEQTVLQMKSGSYSQRVQAEYLKEVEDRGKTVFKELAGLSE